MEVRIPNIISTGRIVLALLLLPVGAFTRVFYGLYLLCGVSDIADGFLARRWHVESEFGARLDSIGDLVFAAVCLWKILPAVYVPRWLWIWIAVIAAIRVVNLICGYVYHGRPVMLHTRANKATGLLLWLLPFGMALVPLVDLAIPIAALATFAAVEEGHLIRRG